MFKQEAEEYAEKHAFRIPYDGSNKFYDDKDYECSKEGFQKGAELGYNKGYHDAEEHYMKVIDSQHKLVDESKKEEFKKCMKCTDSTYQYGFKDGYNNANNWHFIKDRDFPKDTDALYYVLVYSWDFGLSHLYKKYGYYIPTICEWDGEYFKALNKDAYINARNIGNCLAWKEVVLPEDKSETLCGKN